MGQSRSRDVEEVCDEIDTLLHVHSGDEVVRRARPMVEALGEGGGDRIRKYMGTQITGGMRYVLSRL